MRYLLHFMHSTSHKSGQALVETVLVLPLVLLLLFGVIEYGLYINAETTLQQAVRTGTRAAALGEPLGCPGDSTDQELSAGDPPTVYGEVDDSINADHPWMSVAPAVAVIRFAAIIGNQSTTQENNVIVTLVYSYPTIIPTFSLLPQNITLVSTYQMMEQDPQNPADTSTSLHTGSPYEESPQWTQPAPSSTNITYLSNASPCSS